jgi:hypothetical protein
MKTKLFAFLLVVSLALPFASQAATGEAEIIVKTVSTFYKGYLKSLDTSDKKYSWREQSEVDPSFVRKIDVLIGEAQKSEPGFLGYDPILMAQDWPREEMGYATPVMKGDIAEIIVYKNWGGGHKNPLCVTLSKKDAQWRITDIIDMDWFEGEKILECGGLKKAPKEKQ